MQKQNNTIFAFVGTAATGKTFLAKHLSNKFGFYLIPSVTSRPKRTGQETDYKHVSRSHFIRLIKQDEFLEYTEFNGHFYGKLRRDTEHLLALNHCVYTITFDRIGELKRNYPNSVYSRNSSCFMSRIK